MSWGESPGIVPEQRVHFYLLYYGTIIIIHSLYATVYMQQFICNYLCIIYVFFMSSRTAVTHLAIVSEALLIESVI